MTGEPSPCRTCGTCNHPLRQDERNTCHTCVGATRADLYAITNIHALLPALLGHLASNAPNPNTTPSTERPLPGGTVLVLLGPGSGADNRRRAGLTGHDEDWDHDDQPNDPPSVTHELTRWEDELRHTRHEGGAPYPASVTTAARYLDTQLTWAATHHPEFPELHHDLRRLRHTLERAAGLHGPPITAPADCFDCGGQLQRHWTHQGLTDDWTCNHCHRTYDQPAYLLAARTRLETQALTPADTA